MHSLHTLPNYMVIHNIRLAIIHIMIALTQSIRDRSASNGAIVHSLHEMRLGKHKLVVRAQCWVISAILACSLPYWQAGSVV